MTEVNGLTEQKHTLTSDIADKKAQQREIEACLTYLRYEYDQLQTEISEIQTQALAMDEQLTSSGLS